MDTELPLSEMESSLTAILLFWYMRDEFELITLVSTLGLCPKLGDGCLAFAVASSSLRLASISL